jgi:mRNA interferase RelE/StbE
MLYQVELTKSAAKDILRLPVNEQIKITKALKSLEKNPRPVGVKKLKGEADLYRIRIGDYSSIHHCRKNQTCERV